ncbi:MAG: DUF4149 domain-containing protein [Thermodesulfobacteriota bacterium]
MQLIVKSIYSLSLIFWLGSIFFFSLFAAPSIFKVLPKNLAGDLIADIFTKYYFISYVCGTASLITLIISFLKGYLDKNFLNLLGTLLIIIMLGLALYSGTIVRNKVSDVKYEMRLVEQTSEYYNVLKKKFGRLHGESAVLNLVIFIFGIALVIINTYNIMVE